MGSSPIFRIIKLKRVKPWGLALFDFRSGSGPCPHGSKVSAPLRSAQSRHPPDVLRPIFRMAPIVVGQVPMVQGLASGSVVAEQTSPRTSCNPSSARLRLLRGRRPWVQGLRSATVVAEQTSPEADFCPALAFLLKIDG